MFKDKTVEFLHSSLTNNDKMQALYGNIGELLHHRRCVISPAPAVCVEAAVGEQNRSCAGGHYVNSQKWVLCVSYY